MADATDAATAPPHEELDAYTRALFFPLMLMLNLSFFQYLVLLFHARWREQRVKLLLLVSGVSVATLVPFATQSDATVGSLNDVSESCLALILLVQTALVGSRHDQQPAARVTRPLQLFADALIVFNCSVVVLGLACVFQPRLANDFDGTLMINNVAENLTLAFVFVYRFGELGYAKGWRRMVREDRWEIAFHVVFMLHEYPFALLDSLTASSWEYVQAVFMRLALMPCVWMTIGEHHARRLLTFLGMTPKHLVEARSVPGGCDARVAAAVTFAAEDAHADAEDSDAAADSSEATTTPSSSSALDAGAIELRDAAVGAALERRPPEPCSTAEADD